MAAFVPQPLALEEARRFVGTQLERRFNTRQYRGWYAATIEEVNLGSDLGLTGTDARHMWCLLRYQPEEEGDEGDSEDQPWHFVFNSPSDCRRHHMPAGASEWLRSPAAAAAAAADAQAAGAAAQAAAGGQAEEAAPGEALVATQQAGVPQEAEQHGPALAEPPLPPLPAEQMHQPKRRRRASTTVRGRQQAASGPSHAAAPPLPSLAHVVQRASLVCSPQDQPAAGLSAAAGQEQDGGAPAGLHTMAAAAAGEAAGEPPAAPGGGWATGAWRAAAAAEQQSVSRTTPQPQLTEAEVTAALQQAGALQFAQASEPWDPAQQRAPAPAAPAPLSMPGAELPTPQALPQPPAAQRVDGHQAQQQAQEPVRPQEQHSPQLPPPMQQAQQAQHSQPPPQAAAEAGWGGLMARLTRVAQRCVDAGLLDQATAWRYCFKANRPGGFSEQQLAVEVRVMEGIEAAGQLEVAAEAIQTFVAHG